jgi:16S rRNA C1402 N4-methylase RsmH
MSYASVVNQFATSRVVISELMKRYGEPEQWRRIMKNMARKRIKSTGKLTPVGLVSRLPYPQASFCAVYL